MARKLIVDSDFRNRAYSARRKAAAFDGIIGSHATHAKYSLTSFGERRDDAPPTWQIKSIGRPTTLSC